MILFKLFPLIELTKYNFCNTVSEKLSLIIYKFTTVLVYILERKLQQILNIEIVKIYSNKSGMAEMCYSDPMRTMHVNESASGVHDNKFLIKT